MRWRWSVLAASASRLMTSTAMSRAPRHASPRALEVQERARLEAGDQVPPGGRRLCMLDEDLEQPSEPQRPAARPQQLFARKLVTLHAHDANIVEPAVAVIGNR